MIHPIQGKLLVLSAEYALEKMSLRQIGRLIGVSHPQKVKYHLEKLEQNGMFGKYRKHRKARNVPAFLKPRAEGEFISIPILGSANCGEATIFAEENLEGFLKVSPKVIVDKKQLFVLRAEGNSMNKADVYGRNIEHGDYILVDGGNKTPRSGEYVVSIIEGMANIKKFVRDAENNEIILLSESTEDYPPIYIHEEDLPSYKIVGTVIQVLKPPKVEEIIYEPIKE